MDNSDVKDILDIERGPATPQLSKESIMGTLKEPKRLRKIEPLRRPTGMNREVYALLYSDANSSAPSLIPTDTGCGYRQPKARLGRKHVRPWKWMLFTNPARQDNLELSHWRRTADEGKEYPFARFSKKLDIPSFTEDEYQACLTDSSWNKDETEHLLDLCRRFDLRFVVVHDRYDTSRYQSEEFDLTTIISATTTITATLVGAIITTITSCTIFLCKKKCQSTRNQRYVTMQEQDPGTATVINEYAEYLKRHYRQSFPDDDELPTNHKKVYVELAVINRGSLTSCKVRTSLTRDLTETLSLNDILKPREDGTQVRCTLIEGAPGIGKSTLAWQLCHKWEELDSVRQYKLVVLVKLREAREAKCLKDIFYTQARVDIDDILAAIGDGNGILLVLDGFDELYSNQRRSGSFFLNLIKGEELPKATLIVTSRPSVSTHLINPIIDRRLEILSFTEKQIEQYVELNKFSNSKSQEAFQQYISNPIIKGMMYLPLYAVIITSIFDGSNSPQLNTMIQLYDALTRSLIRRYLIRKGELSDDSAMPRSLQSKLDIEKLPKHDRFYKLVKEAYNSLENEKYHFTGLEFDDLGVMKKTLSVTDSTGHEYAFSYLHLTLQEYLAALHIFYTPNLVVPKSFCKRDVLRFLAGLCTTGDENVTKKVGNMLQSVGDQLNLQLVRCVYECDAIVQKIPMIRGLFNKGSISVSRKMPLDYYLIGHCVCHVGGQWSITVHSREEIDLLVRGLESERIKGTIQDLELLASSFQILLPLLGKYTEIRCFELYFVVFSESDVAIFKKYILHNVIRKIVIGRSCRNIDLLLPVLFSQSSLDTVHLRGTCDTSTAEAAHDLLCANKNLKELLLDDTIIDPEKLAEVVRSNDTLKELTFCVTENDRSSVSSSLSSSFPGRFYANVNSEPCLLNETPMSILEREAKNKNLNLTIVNPRDTVQAPSRGSFTTSHHL